MLSGGAVSDKTEAIVIEWGDPSDLPPSAVPVPDETPVTDWAEETAAP